ncbi:hypothetical protein HDU91_004481 [Kappamyces sp. JEL0680]|nr:hypothetical protein HDU91_004481 [Kappamyces sp. JEL0680]
MPAGSDTKAERAIEKGAKAARDEPYRPREQPNGLEVKYEPIGSDLQGKAFDEAMARYGLRSESANPTKGSSHTKSPKKDKKHRSGEDTVSKKHKKSKKE